MRVGNEDRRQSGGRELPDRAAGARKRHVGGAVGRADLVREREQAVVGTCNSIAQHRVIPLAAEMKDGGARCPPALGRELVQAESALAPPQH